MERVIVEFLLFFYRLWKQPLVKVMALDAVLFAGWNLYLGSSLAGDLLTDYLHFVLFLFFFNLAVAAGAAICHSRLWEWFLANAVLTPLAVALWKAFGVLRYGEF